MKSVINKKVTSLLLGIALVGIFQAAAQAQADAYPNRPIKLVITWPVGG